MGSLDANFIFRKVIHFKQRRKYDAIHHLKQYFCHLNRLLKSFNINFRIKLTKFV